MAALTQTRPFEGQTEQLGCSALPRPDSKKEHLQVLVEADDEQCLIRDATVINTKEITKTPTLEPPAIPKRNNLRTSQYLDTLRLSTIKSASQSISTTHSVYMSSEEDVSSSAGDFSDNEYEASCEEVEKLPLRRKSKEIVARAVSVVFVGKPSVVDLSALRRPVSPAKRPKSEFITRDASTRLGADLSSSNAETQRNSTLAPSSAASRASLYPSPTFLNQDPYGPTNPQLKRQSTLKLETSFSKSSLQSSNTPTKAFQRFQKTIGLARNYSRSSLKVSSQGIASTSSLNLPSLNMSQESQDSTSRSEILTPISYNDMLKSSRRTSVSGSSIAYSVTTLDGSLSPKPTKRGILSGFNMTRRRTMKFKP